MAEAHGFPMISITTSTQFEQNGNIDAQQSWLRTEKRDKNTIRKIVEGMVNCM